MNNTVEIKEERKPMRTAIKLVVVAIILVLLVFLSIGIVRIVPKALNSLASASLSIGGVFSGDKASSTNTAANANNSASGTSGSNTGVNSNGSGGFSIRDLTNPHSSSTPNWIPAPAGTNTSGTVASSNSNSSSNSYSNSSSNSNTSTGSYSGSYGMTTNDNGQASNPNYRTIGPSDIAVTILSKGVISKSTGQFVPTNNFTTDDMVVVKFKMENRGLYATGPWTARVDMPSNDAADKVRMLGPVGSLYAGGAVTGEARFNHPLAGNQVFTMTVDSTNTTQDVDRNDNIATAPIYTTGNNIGGNGGTYNPGTAGDLQLTILQTGTVNAYGQFVPNNSPRIGEKVAVRFQVTNVGGTAIPAWAWRADLSGSTYNTYTASEAGLAPGASARIIVGFDTFNYGVSTLTITADSNNMIFEPNEANNTSAVTLNVNY
jgi:hypothetical protein